MHLHCPNCQQPVPSEQINIQHMLALCPACHNLFRLDDTPDEPNKAKRRPVQQPRHLYLDETPGELTMSFRTNFRLDRSEAFISGVSSVVLFTLLTWIFGAGLPIFFSAFFGLMALSSAYRLGLLVFNWTHVAMQGNRIRVSRRPLPSMVNDTRNIDLTGVMAIRAIETPISIKAGYDTPRYTVWAEMVDGTREMIVHDVITEYAYFIAQKLNARLQTQPLRDTNRLENGAAAALYDTYEVVDDVPEQEIRQSSILNGDG